MTNIKIGDKVRMNNTYLATLTMADAKKERRRSYVVTKIRIISTDGVCRVDMIDGRGQATATAMGWIVPSTVSSAARALGSRTSAAKKASSRENGKRPPKPGSRPRGRPPNKR